MSIAFGHTDGQPDKQTYIYTPLDKRYSLIISSICGPKNELSQECNCHIKHYLISIPLSCHDVGFDDVQVERDGTSKRPYPACTPVADRHIHHGYHLRVGE